MKGRRISWAVILAVIVLDLIAFGLAIGGEIKRSTAAGTEDESVITGDYVYCKYKSDKASGFGAGAILFLLAGQAVVMSVTKCLCCGCPYKPGAARFFAVVSFILVWVTFFLAEVFLVIASAKNTVHTKKAFELGSEELTCKQLRKGIFNAGAAFSFLTMVLSVIYYIFITKADNSPGWDPYRDGNVGMTQL
eukprot:TRINITY_DN5745_c0_g1_i1.p1 TRINITY_DN5745_c0_g1~~TRINITY_DN5745_c0_g1_i1.p1  ORF type:complete len:192 (+),score=20.44 TRINITY_DN5745_c0_g1_i1:389-964(+)